MNIPWQVIHSQLDQLLKELSFSQHQVEQICMTAGKALKDAQVVKEKQAEAKKEELNTVKVKIERLEERLVNDEIEADTYKKYYRKFQTEKALLTEEVSYLKESVSDKLDRQLELLPYLVNLSAIYDKANLNQKHSLLCGVFKHGLTYKESAFRTPYLNPAFRHNLLKIN